MNVIKVKVGSIKIGSKISNDIVGKNNNVIVKKDTVVDKEVLDTILINMIEEIYVYDDSSNLDQQDIKGRVDEIFSKVNNDDFIKKLYAAVLEFRTKNKL